MIARREFMAGLAGVLATGPLSPLEAKQPDRDIVLVIFHGMSVSPAQSDYRGIAAIIKNSTQFSQAYAATASPLAHTAVIKSGLYAHQLGPRGVIHSPWPANRQHAALYFDLLREAGYAFSTISSNESRQARQAKMRSLLSAGRNFCIEFNVHDAGSNNAHDAYAVADTFLTALPNIWTRLRRSQPLIVLVGCNPAMQPAPLVEQRMDLYIAKPGRPVTASMPTLVSSVDIVPTLLDWAEHQSALSHLPGQSLLPLLAAQPLREDVIFASHDHISLGRFTPVRTIRTKRFRLTHSLPINGGTGIDVDAVSLFDLDQDPDNGHNIIGRNDMRETVELLEARLKRHRLATQDPLTAI